MKKSERELGIEEACKFMIGLLENIQYGYTREQIKPFNDIKRFITEYYKTNMTGLSLDECRVIVKKWAEDSEK